VIHLGPQALLHQLLDCIGREVDESLMLLVERLEGVNEQLVFGLELLQCGVIFSFLVLHVLNGLGRLLFDALLLGHVDHLVRVSLEIPHFLERVLHLPATFLQLLLLLLRLLMEQLGLRQNFQGFFAQHLIFVAPYNHHCFVHRVAHLEAHIVVIL
jgi:hypothetical protein